MDKADGPAPSLAPEALGPAERVTRDPADEDAWEALDEHARDTQRPDAISALYLRVLRTALSPALADAVGRRAVAFHDEWFEDPAHVIEVLRRVLELRPDAEWAFERLSLLLTMAERWEDLLSAYDAALAATSDREKKKALLDEAARIAKDFAGSADRAVSYLKQLVPLRPEDSQLAQSLERRLLLQRRYRDLIEVWQARLHVLSAAEALAARVRIAETWLDKIGEAPTALGVVRELIASGAGEAQAAGLLERIGTKEGADVEVRREALQLLHDRLDAAGRAAEVVHAVELLLGVADSVEERVHLRAEATSRLADLGRAEAAVEHAAEWLVLSPARDVEARLRTLADAASRWDRYAGALERAAEATTDGAVRVEFLMAAAERRSTALGEPDRAIALYGRVLGDDSASHAVSLEGARRLVELLVGDAHRAARLDVLERLAALEGDAAEQRRVLGEAATLARELGDVDRALGLWRRRREQDPGDAEALDAIVELLGEHRRWDALVAALEQRAASGADAAQRRADLVRVAEVQRSELDDLPRAIEAWRRVEAEFGASAESTDALADLSSAAERWSDVTQLLREAARRADDPGRRAAHLARMGDVWRTQRSAPVRAAEAYREALEVLPVLEPARAGLVALLDDADAGALAVETLAAAHSAAGEWQGLLGLVERRVARAPDDRARRDVLVEAAGLAEGRAGDAVAALGLQCRAFALLAEPAVEAEVVRIAEASGGWGEAASAYASAIKVEAEDARRADLLFSHGAILERRLGDPAAALPSYARVTELDPGRVPAQVALVRVAGRTGRWELGADALVRSAITAGRIEPKVARTFAVIAEELSAWSPAASALSTALARAGELSDGVAHDLYRQLGVWQRDRRDDLDAAEAALGVAASRRAEPETLRLLAELERRSPGRPLVGTLLRLSAATGDDLEVLAEAGAVARHAVRDAELSRPIFEKLLELSAERWRAGSTDAGEDRHALAAVEELVALALASDDGVTAVDLLERGAELPAEPQVARALRYRAAELSAERVGDTSNAIALCRRILDEAPEDAAPLALLSGLYAAEGKLEELLELRRRELALGPPVARRLLLRLDAARVLGLLGGDVEVRVASLRDNLADEPGHPDSVDAIEALLLGADRAVELHAELCRQAELVQATGRADEAAALYARAGRLASERLGSVERAIDAYRRSVALRPTVEVLDALAAVHQGRGEHAAAAGWLEKRLELTDPAEQETIRATVIALATAYRASGREEQARRVLGEALGRDPAAVALRELLSELYRLAEDWALLAPLLAEGVDHVASDDERVGLLRQAAHVHRRRLGDLEAAIPLLERAAALAGEDRGVRLSLADALRAAGRFDEARALLEAMLAEFGRRRTPDRARVHYHLARIAQVEGNLEQALAQLESASSIERSDPRILRLLGDVARAKGEVEAAERAYRALLLILRRQGPAAPADEGEDEVVTAGEVLYTLSRMEQEQGHADRAAELLESAFEAAALDNVEALRLERVLRAEGQPELVLRVLDARLARIEDPAAAAEILVARAELLAASGNLEDALGSLLDALRRTPGSVTLLSSAHDLAVRAGALDRYVERLASIGEELATTDALLASDVFLRLGGLAENEIGDAAAAARWYQRSLATGRRPLRAYRALDRVLPESALEERRAALEAFVGAPDRDESDPTPRTDALYRLAALELAEPATREVGARRLGDALAREGDHQRALDALRPALEAPPVPASVAGLLEQVARSLGDAPLLLEALRLRVAAGEGELSLLREATELARRLSDEGALVTFLEGLVTRAREESALGELGSALTDLAVRREERGDLGGAAALLEEAAALTSGGEAFDLLLRVARLAEAGLGDLSRAASVYERLRRVEPADARAWRPLLELYRKLGARAELETCIAETVDAVYEPAERNHLRMERGRILLEDPERQEEAERVLREVLDKDPDHVQASVVLSELFERAGRHAELAELLERQLSSAKDRADGAAVATVALRMGRGLEATDRPAARAIYADALEFASDDRALLEALIGLCSSPDDAADRATYQERLLELESGAPAGVLALGLADLARTLGDESLEERALRRGVSAGGGAAVRARLLSYYEDRGDLGGLAAAIAEDARARPPGPERVARLREAAGLQRERLGDPGAAAELLRDALEGAPDDADLLLELVGAEEAAGHADRALEVVTGALAGGAVATASRGPLLVVRARLAPAVAGREISVLTASIQDLDAATELGVGDLEPALASLLEDLRVVSGEAGDEGAEREATMRLASLLPRLGDQRRGLELLVGWVKRYPGDAGAVRGLGQFAANAEKWSAAAKAFARLVEITTGAQQVDAAARLAEACEKGGVPMDARAALEAVYAANPGDELLRGRLRRMYEAAGAYGELARIMVAEAEQAADDDTRFERLTEAADVSLRAEGGMPTAIDALRRAHALRPEAHAVVMKLADALAGSSAIEEAAQLLDQAIEAHGKRRSPELSELQHCMARVGRLAGDWEAVFAWLDAAVQTDRQNGAAAAELAVVAMDRDELDTAVKALQVITLLKGDCPMSKAEAYLRQGIIAERKGDPKKAVFLAKRALTQDADYADARAFVERLGG